ncbi:M64 family metallopeptidase [Dyadobacter sp. CY343]|uniref:M64 family metallopeptidase n=1 Tax=Dyadobacter sp. CY343 TaxID=2907299 RepID=UPI001F3062B1|nr:M64 family metallopeptidase [Dyadobacter sp. CY343]MCE7060492.1 M64 family metallo-endopeptidase [Dyadobacter sp. CY343]
MKKTFTALFFILCAARAFAQEFPVDTLYKTGPLDSRINVVILGDGFTEAEMPKFRTEAKKFADFLLEYQPYNRYKSYFNFFAIPTPSEESGVSNPGTAPDAYPDQPVGTKKTYYSGTFGSTIHRLVTINFTAAYNVLAANLPTYDLIVVLINTTYYGGSGGSIAVHTLNESANTIGAHEIGHTFTSLNDEYWAGPQYGWEAANMTEVSNPAEVKWKNWLDSEGIGVYKHGSDSEAARWHKPANGKCLMEYLNQEFCVVCREATTERILSIVDPVGKIEPDTSSAFLVKEAASFKFDLLRPEPNSMQIEWQLDGQPLANGVDEVILKPEDIAGSGKLTATVFDSTHLSRAETMQMGRIRTLEWRVQSNSPAVFKIISVTDSLCAGGSTTLTASGCSGPVSWSTGVNGNAIIVTPGATTTYTGTCPASEKTATATITVLPLPEVVASNTGPYFEGAAIELNASGEGKFFWVGPDNFTSTDQKANIRIAKIAHSGTYTVKVTNQFGCSDTASTVVIVEPILGTNSDPAQWVRVSPNPASDFINVTTSLSGESELTIYNIAGKKIRTKVFTKETEMKLNVTAGMYVYRLSNGGKEISGKLLIK